MTSCGPAPARPPAEARRRVTFDIENIEDNLFEIKRHGGGGGGRQLDAAYEGNNIKLRDAMAKAPARAPHRARPRAAAERRLLFWWCVGRLGAYGVKDAACPISTG